MDDLVQQLSAAGCVYAVEEAMLLRAEAVDEEHLEQLAERRIAGEPLEQVLGWAEFWGRRLAVAPGVFVPRQRTLLLAREAVALTPTDALVLDLCCGVGPVAAAIAAERPGAIIHLSDVDPIAVECARTNVPTAIAHAGDLFTPLPTDLRFDVIAVNAPYVPSDEIAFMPSEARQHEHPPALDGGEDGVQVHRRIASKVNDWLTPEGHVLIETAEHLAALTTEALEENGLATRMVRDDDLGATVVIGIPTGATGQNT